MSSYEEYTVPELRKLIIDKDDFKSRTGISVSTARRVHLVKYLARLNGMDPPTEVDAVPTESSVNQNKELPKPVLQLDNRPFNPLPPKVDKSFVPDSTKLEEIRKNLETATSAPKNILEPETSEGLDREAVIDLNKIIGDTGPLPGYEYEESVEIKVRKYVELYPNLKPIASSPEFKSSKEKLAYIENYLNSTRMNANITNWLFMATSVLERNETVNQYIHLRGYTQALGTRKNEIETYVEELKIKYMDEVGSMLEMPVEARLGLVFAEVALAVHMQNSAGAQTGARTVPRPVPQQPRPQPVPAQTKREQPEQDLPPTMN